MKIMSILWMIKSGRKERNQLEKVTIEQLESRILRHAIWNREKTQVNWLNDSIIGSKWCELETFANESLFV